MALLALGIPARAAGQDAAPDLGHRVLAHLNHVLRWSRQWNGTTLVLPVSGDEFYLENGRALARQVVSLEFQSALAQAALIGATPPPGNPTASPPPNTIDTHSILSAQERVGRKMLELRAQLDALNGKIAHARAKEKPALTSQQETVQGQLQLAQVLHDNLEKLTSFVNSEQNLHGAANELTAKILALQRGTPGITIGTPTVKETGKTHPAPASPVGHRGNSGMIGQVGELFHYVQSLRTIGQLREDGNKLQHSTEHLRAPLLAALRETLRQGQLELTGAGQGNPTAVQNVPSQPATAPAAPTTTRPVSGPAAAPTPEQQRQATAALVRHFTLLSHAALPLSQEMVLLAQSQNNLNQLQASIRREYGSVLRSLLLKTGGILIALVVIWLISELWRKATFRYVREARRRRQFLVLRRVVTGFFMVLVILLGFVSDFSSLATYAGLITAGVAVALQALILSVAAYFFLVGRYGVKVGDRITVVYAGNNSVAGDVVDIGLIRFYMMELAGSGIDVQPTGRVCVFPNSVLFQTNPLFKQWPGTEYSWREIALTLGPESDGPTAEKELMATVQTMYSSYQSRLERQHLSIEETMGVYMDTPKPSTRVRFAGSGLEVVVRYPIPLRQAAELDDRMVMEVREMLRKNPSIQLAAGSAPELRAPVKG